jgi:hypothetical protein
MMEAQPKQFTLSNKKTVMKKNIIFIALFVLSTNAFAQDIKQMLKAKPFKMSGSLSLRNVYMTGGQALKGGNTNSIMFNGNTTVSIYGFDIPLSFNWSPQAQSFQQPFNQYGASPKYKWLTIHAGYRNISYNPYTLAGHTIYGVGFDIAPKKFRFGAMYGRLATATVLDTVSQSLQPISFSRKGYAAHIGFAGAKNMVDLSMIVAEDDSSSIGNNLSKISQRYGKEITPSGNVAAGLMAKFQITKNIFWEGNYALSIYTRDVRNPSLLDETNSNTDVRNISKKLVQINQSTEYYNAIQTAIGFKSKGFGLRLRYLRVQPEFKTMGAYFINSDVQNITIMPSFSLLKKKVNVNASIGVQNDNLNKLKRTTANRIIGSMAVNAMLSKQFMINANYNNYSINQVPNVQRIADTFRVTQSTQNINLTPVYTNTNAKRTNSILGNINYNTLNDFNTAYAASAQSRTLNTISALLSFKQNFIASKFGYTLGVNYNAISGNVLNDNNYGGNIGIDKSFKNDVFTIGLTNTVLVGKRNNSNSLIINAGIQASSKIGKMHRFNVGAFVNNTQLKSATTTNNINYLRGDLSYTLNF